MNQPITSFADLLFSEGKLGNNPFDILLSDHSLRPIVYVFSFVTVDTTY